MTQTVAVYVVEHFLGTVPESIRDTMEPLVARLDAARALPRSDPQRLPECCAARDALFAYAAQVSVGTLVALDAAAALGRAGTSDGARCAALGVLCEEAKVPHLELICEAACAATSPHSSAPPFVVDVARLAFARVLTRNQHLVSECKAAQLASNVEAMPVPADNDDEKRRAWRTHVLSTLRTIGLKPFVVRRMKPLEVRERLLGSVLWQALGDALGFLVEGRSAAEAAAFTRDVVRTGHVLRFGLTASWSDASKPRYLPLDGSAGPVTYAFGQYTDDTQCMRELLISIVATGGVLHAGHYRIRRK